MPERGLTLRGAVRGPGATPPARAWVGSTDHGGARRCWRRQPRRIRPGEAPVVDEETFPALVCPGRAGRRGSHRRAWLPLSYLLWRTFGTIGWACPRCDLRTRLRCVVLHPPGTTCILVGLHAAQSGPYSVGGSWLRCTWSTPLMSPIRNERPHGVVSAAQSMAAEEGVQPRQADTVSFGQRAAKEEGVSRRTVERSVAIARTWKRHASRRA